MLTQCYDDRQLDEYKNDSDNNKDNNFIFIHWWILNLVEKEFLVI